MLAQSSLSEDQRQSAVALFEIGWGDRAVSTKLGVRRSTIRRLHDRWLVRGGTTLVAKPTKRVFSFDFKLTAGSVISPAKRGQTWPRNSSCPLRS
ncbi:helix-turn-helix domain-containing protein [Arthrobacter citreus]|uniref:helix-turn-helix domain-containing protein n=1 Tax=Arthrobacter citreus TaxID=1670 RepID=UPI003CCAE86F